MFEEMLGAVVRAGLSGLSGLDVVWQVQESVCSL